VRRQPPLLLGCGLVRWGKPEAAAGTDRVCQTYDSDWGADKRNGRGIRNRPLESDQERAKQVWRGV
jgi:hypothetical protein